MKFIIADEIGYIGRLSVIAVQQVQQTTDNI